MISTLWPAFVLSLLIGAVAVPRLLRGAQPSSATSEPGQAMPCPRSENFEGSSIQWKGGGTSTKKGAELAAQDAIDIGGRAAEHVRETRPICD